MRRLSSLIVLIVLAASLYAQKSPHGKNFTASCRDCHKTDGWKVDLKTISFDHKKTKFPLVGQHQGVTCRSCHTSLEFTNAKTECNACHIDIHEQTVGQECARCHTPNSWIVTNITQLHQQSGFPLLGAHRTTACKDCHTNLMPSGTSAPAASLLRFDPLGTECYDCHKDNYSATTKPNHVQNNYSKNCTECHKFNAISWIGAGINHDFFPLTEAHAINCISCHTSGSFSKIPAECISCHQPDYASTASPKHSALNFSTNCKDCHTLAPGWKPAEYKLHDAQSFPVYTGKHKGQWNTCADCHTNPGNYAQFTCTACHEHNQTETDNKHSGISGYKYNSSSCLACHPTGTANGSIDHNKTSFPLTGVHTTTACADCHTNGYKGTSNICSSCHTNNYNQTTNPNHKAIGISTDCALCHTTIAGWKPATFPTHNSIYKLEGAHLTIANNCVTCHNGNYTNTPNTCMGCHTGDYNLTANPAHKTAQFPTTCLDCHTQTAWSPSTFNHDGQYFPINSGKHKGEWNSCATCHTNASNYAVFSCITSCHSASSTNKDHQGVTGYSYNSNSCYTCHPKGTTR